MASPGADAIDSRDVAARFPNREFTHVTHFEGFVDGSPVYFRQGDLQPRGYRVTIRMREPFGQAVREGRGYLCMDRGRCFLIPHKKLRDWLGSKLSRQTVDIYLDFESDSLSTADVLPLQVREYGGT